MNYVPLWCCYPWLCVSLLVPYSLGSHSRLGGDSVVERFKITWAYGWVEHCSDVASCGVKSSSKISVVPISSLQLIYCFINYDEHVKCWNVCVASAEC